jgi:hypothetical protein
MMVGIYYFHIGEVWLFELTFSVDISYKVIFQKKKKIPKCHSLPEQCFSKFNVLWGCLKNVDLIKQAWGGA